jgi:hypothetical protein
LARLSLQAQQHSRDMRLCYQNGVYSRSNIKDYLMCPMKADNMQVPRISILLQQLMTRLLCSCKAGVPGSCTVVGSICPLSVMPVLRDCSTKLLLVLTKICS